jgi:hypothetical protein
MGTAVNSTGSNKDDARNPPDQGETRSRLPR